MLGQAIHACPDSLWLANGYPNRFWHVAYHAVFYTHLYLQPTHGDFQPRPKHKQDSQYLGPRPWAPEEAPKVFEPYTRTEVLEYRELCLSEIEPRLAAVDFATPSGFDWLPLSKLELQFYNIRHVQHHTGQLLDRLRTVAGIGIKWVRSV